MSRQVLVLKQHSYAMKLRSPGQTYQAAERDLRILEAMKLVTTRLPVQSSAEEEPVAKARRRYRRRDMEAEN